MLDTLDLTAFRDLGIETRSSIVAAVSGGSDSLALLLLLKRLIERRNLATKLVAVTVDHGLRSASADEARWVAASCARLGIEHRTLEWSGPKPVSGLADASRLNRYRLLADAAGSVGTDLILTGHTLDDQAETVAMRSARGAGRGLSGMAPATLFDRRAWILRPLLGHRRLSLRDVLAREGETWIDDPSNIDMKNERARIREHLANAPREIEALASTASKAGHGRFELGHAAAGIISNATMASDGLFRVPVDALAGDRRTVTVYALGILLAAIGGRQHLPAVQDVGDLLDDLLAGRHSATLSGTVADRRRGWLYLHRESRGLPSPAMVEGPVDWDNRLRIVAAVDPLHVSPFGASRARAALVDRHDLPRGIAAAALAAEPWIARGDDADQAHPLHEFERLVSPWERFMPAFDSAPRNAVARLFGSSLLAVSPSSGPIGGKP